MKFLEIVSEDCWKGYKQVGMKKKGARTVPNCVPSTNEAEGDAAGVEHLTPELVQHILEQIKTEGVHAIVKSIEWGDGAATELTQLIIHALEQYAHRGNQ